MTKRKIIYITNNALNNLPEDTPIYVLLDPESIPINDNLAESHLSSNDNSETKVSESADTLPKIDCFGDLSLETKIDESIESTTVVENNEFYPDINDEFITTIDVETTDTINNNRCQSESPDFVTQFYDSLYKEKDDSYGSLEVIESIINDDLSDNKMKDNLCCNKTNSDDISAIDSFNNPTGKCIDNEVIDSVANIVDKTVDNDSITSSFVQAALEIDTPLSPDNLNEKIQDCDLKLSEKEPDINLKEKSQEVPALFNSFDFVNCPPPGFLLEPEKSSHIINTTIQSKDQTANNIKTDEIQKIKARRRAEANLQPKLPIEFRQYKYIEMELNEKFMVKCKKNKKIVYATKALKELENEFEQTVIKRRENALKDQCAWEKLDRSQFKSINPENSMDIDLAFSSSDEEYDTNSVNLEDEEELIEEDDEDEEDDDNDKMNDEISSMKKQRQYEKEIAASAVETDTGFTKAQLKELARIEKKVAETRRRLHYEENNTSKSQNKKNNSKMNCNYSCRRRSKLKRDSNATREGAVSGVKRPKQSMEYLTVQENSLHNNAPVISGGRSLQQQAEISHKLAHPHKLHKDIWYNEFGELNDGPACSCHERYRIGPLHNDFPGEHLHKVNCCSPNSNNFENLYHYKLVISPPNNFLSATPTRIEHNNSSFAFSGFSIFTHEPIANLPSCQVVRYNIVYHLTLVKEPFPIGFTIRSLDLITDYLFTELLELIDINWWNLKGSNASENHCRSIHLFPRFEKYLKEPLFCESGTILKDGAIQLLPTDVIIQWLLDNAQQPLFNVLELPKLHSMSISEWSEYIDSLRGSLATYPGKKPSTIRIDQLDRESLESKESANTNTIIFPIIVHMNMVPLKLGLTREPAYKRLLKNFLKLQYLILNRPEITKEDKNELNNLARLLENFEMNGIQRREFTVEISSDGFYRTGIKTDMVQFALCIPSMMNHIRFHLSLTELENRLKYTFKDKSLLHQALTHPSYRNTNYGTNPDHYQNTNISCGLRNIEYGDKISLYRSFRKKGLSKMIQVMSYMPFRYETKSSIFGNERLECLGDAIIELITSVHLFYMFPELSEGHLDSFRQALVQNHYLANLSVRLGFHRYLLYTHNTDFSFDSTITHARSDAFEAVMAAITLDGGLDEADRIFGSALFGDDRRVHRVWCQLPEHPLQQQFPKGDRHVIQNSPIFKNLTKLEDRLGIKFYHIRLLAKAMTVRKTGYNVFTLGDNQRLEFLGDSLLKYVTTDYLFKHFPRHHEGHLSLLRNTLVNRYTQARVCRELGLDEFVIRKDSSKNPSGSAVSGQGTNNATAPSGKFSQKPNADLLEAFLGALFVDKDLSWVERFCQVCFWPRLVHFILNQKWNDPKSRLQQCCLTYRSLHEDPEIAHYKLISTYGSTDNREFKVAVYYRGNRLATGYGGSIQMAEMNAANLALENYKDIFKQLGYQEKVIQQQYDDGVRKKMLNQYENWDNELVDKFVDKSTTSNSNYYQQQQHNSRPSRSIGHSSSAFNTGNTRYSGAMHHKLAPQSHKPWHNNTRYHTNTNHRQTRDYPTSQLPGNQHSKPSDSDRYQRVYTTQPTSTKPSTSTQILHKHNQNNVDNEITIKNLKMTSTLGDLLKNIKTTNSPKDN